MTGLSCHDAIGILPIRDFCERHAVRGQARRAGGEKYNLLLTKSV